MRRPLAATTLVAVFIFSVLMLNRTDVNSSNALNINEIGQASTTITTETYTITSIYSYTVSSTSTSYSTTTTFSTTTQTAVTVSTILTTTTTTDTSTSWRVQTSTSMSSRTSTSVVVLSSFTTTASLTETSTSLYPTVTVTSMNASYRTTTVFSPLVTTSLIQTSVMSTTSFVTTLFPTTTTATATTTIARPCVIASAAYGSELAPHVQFLREFRERAVLPTFAGAQFMRIFNAFYYSFSPVVAQAILANPSMALVVRILIFPLIASLGLAAWVSPVLSQNTELGTLFAGVAASGLIGVIYGMPIPFLGTIRRRRHAYCPASKD